MNSKLIIVNFFKNCFEASLSSKTNFLSLWKRHFSVFSKLFNDKIQTIFWESDAKGQKLFKSKFGLSKPLRKWFWSYLDVKSKCSGPLKITFFSSLQFFEWKPLKVKTIFWESEAKHQILVIGSFLENKFWSFLELKSEYCGRLKRAFFSFLQIFDWRSWNRFQGMWGKVLKFI